MNANILQNFSVRVIGEGDNYLVLGHGIGTDQSVWTQILPYFHYGIYRIVLYDLACAGTVNPELYDFVRYSTIDAYVDDLIQILDALNVNHCTFIGHSASAMVGILASIRCPDRFTKLILFGASPRYVNDNGYNGGVEILDTVHVIQAMESNYQAWVHGFVPQAIGADMPEAIQEFSRTLFNIRPDISRHVLSTIIGTDIRGVLGQVTVRCHIIQTARDLSVPLSAAEYLRQHLGGRTTLENLNTVGHLPHLTAPGLLGPAIRRALCRP
ncbi:hypothetical protein LWI29_038454 [Acer saccharum]|uniref:AB hydrolase-1 domain-containing protein n=1 Tax=Acer saccharum TaxID=4024 RepID=A0AA39W8G7_ACESA|nr:hypothetical protein LWI29_038454 [Acer saccharum]KAK1586477.1 hypothetical protein Q3G72_002924 [Acer saccharum]